jgi:hypothetical protein
VPTTDIDSACRANPNFGPTEPTWRGTGSTSTWPRNDYGTSFLPGHLARRHPARRYRGITLYDSSGRAIPKQRLSEGEKQIFAVSVLWGLARAAARPLPAVIDTPMARLDATHRRHLVERYFPHASHQVVIFSTDTEVDRESYRLLQPAIARAYHLHYDEAGRYTVGEEGYFWKDEVRVAGEAS